MGSGGVGKTTMAAALGLHARSLGLNVLVLTVDPAKRLATALGLDLSGVEERAVVPGFSAAVIDSKRVFDQFIVTHATDTELIVRLQKNRLYQQLSTTLSGSQEFTALERLLQAVESEKYDLVILDTPPTQHALDFLSAPDRIRGLFQDSITRWFMNPEGAGGGGIIGSIIGRGTKVALKSLEILTGARFIDELIDFFASIRSLQKTLRDRSQRVHDLLTSDDAKFVLVTSFDAAKLLEARHIGSYLKQFKFTLGACILNRAFPEKLVDLETQLNVPAGLQDAARRLGEFHARVKADHQRRFALFQDFESKIEKGVIVIRVPEYRQDIFGLTDLESLAKFLGESVK